MLFYHILLFWHIFTDLGYTLWHSGFICAYDIFYLRAAEGALTAPLTPPLLDSTPIAHTHMTAHIQHAVNRIFVTDCTLCTCQIALTYDRVYRSGDRCLTLKTLTAGRGSGSFQSEVMSVGYLNLLVLAVLIGWTLRVGSGGAGWSGVCWWWNWGAGWLAHGKAAEAELRWLYRLWKKSCDQ